MNITFAVDKDQFLTWCKGWMIDPAPIKYSLVGESKEGLKKELDGTEYDLILLLNWNRREYADEELCNAIILNAASVYSVPNRSPLVDKGKIVGWSSGNKLIQRSVFLLPYTPATHSGPSIWNKEKDAILIEKFSQLSAESLAIEIGCTINQVRDRYKQLHLKEKLGIRHKPHGKRKPVRWRW